MELYRQRDAGKYLSQVQAEREAGTVTGREAGKYRYSITDSQYIVSPTPGPILYVCG